VDAGEPQSYQPFAVMDALLALGLAARHELQVAAVDINPRVVEWIQRARGTRRRLHLASGVAETDRVRFTSDFRQYFASIGQGISNSERAKESSGRLVKWIDMDLRIAPRFGAIRLDVVVDRIDRQFDLIIVTNVFPYLSDTDLLLALTNLNRMLARGGTLLHNEPRPMLAEGTSALNLALIHSRSAVIATVEGADSPLYDAIWMHRAPE
jgi:chemotaxis methyl-accepting protein methylase